MSQASPGFPVVGIGASAGGIEALQAFFAHVPADSGCAYVVILHLSPEYQSELASVLQAVTSLPVAQVTERVRVEPDHVYVVPPNRHLTMVDGEVQVSPNTLPEERRAPVDLFLRTLAESHGGRGVCVVLSGSGADGSGGLKRVKERGGAVFVQHPREAAYGDMPRSAIATDLVDEVLPVAEIPARISAYRASLWAGVLAGEAEPRPEEQEQALHEVLARLDSGTGHDLSGYKRTTLLRRIERRLTLRNLPGLPAYAAYLREHPDEVQALLRDLLISVTNFFRDSEAFAALEQEILPRLFQNREPGDQVRIWVAGCATGEEAYSLAMLCAEQAPHGLDAPSVQIFATDIDEAAITRARAGRYSAADTLDIPPERLQRFLTSEGDHYRIRRELRDMVLFATHNLLKDPPFSHIDLVTCRNLLVYLDRTAQQRVMETLHFALNPGGYLLLGSAETTVGAGQLFDPTSLEHRLFQRRPTATRWHPLREPAPALQPSLRQMPAPTLPDLPPPPADEQPRERLSPAALHHRLLEQYAPPSLLLNPDFDVVHMSEHAGRYLRIAAGAPTTSLVELIRPELRVELRTALAQAMQRQTGVDTHTLPITIDGRQELLTIRVRPEVDPDDPARRFVLVLFEADAAPAPATEVIAGLADSAAHHLEEEVARLRQHLRGADEQHEEQTEELLAANEELQALNEELRSSAEELEISKEELQALNEELRTVNQELKVKVEAVTQTSANLQNLVNSTEIGTIFLNRSMRIQLFTPAARTLFNLIPADDGRPLSDITHRLLDVDVLAEAEHVLATLQPIEREVHTADDRIYVLRVLPYRTYDEQIGGVILTFFDITERKRAEEVVAADLRDMRLLHALSSRLVGEGDVHVLYDAILAAAITLMQANAGTLQILDEPTQELVLLAAQGFDQTMTSHFHRVDTRSNTPSGAALATGTRTIVDFDDPSPSDPDGSMRLHRAAGYLTGQSTPLVSRSGRQIGMFSTHWRAHHRPTERELRFLDLLARQAADLIEQMSVAEALRESEQRFRHLVEAYAQAVWETSAEGVVVVDSPSWRARTGQSFEEWVGHGWLDAVHPDDRDDAERQWREAVAAQRNVDAELRLRCAPGGWRWINVRATPLRGPDGSIQKWAGMNIDIHERKVAEAAARRAATLDAFRVRLSDALRPLADPAALQAEAARLLGEQLGVSRVLYGEVAEDGATLIVERNYVAGGAPLLTGRFRMADFGPALVTALNAGQTVALPDIASAAELSAAERDAYAALGIAALAGVPLTKGGRFVANINVHDAVPHLWTADEIALIEETADRTWAAVERVRAEVALRASDTRFRTLIDAVPQVIWANDADGRAIYFNQRWFAYSGLSLEESVGPGWQAIVHPEDAAASIARWQHALADGEIFDAEYRLRRADGGYRWHLGRNVPLHDEHGRVVGWFGSATDIEELKQAEAARRESEERFRLLVEGARDYAMFLLDPDNRITYWSTGAERVFGWSEAEVIGADGSLIFTPDDRAAGAVEREIRTALDTGSAVDRRWHLTRAGARLFLDGVLIRLDDGQGGLRGFARIGRDATAQRQAEEAVERANAELEVRVQQRTADLQAEIAQRVAVEHARQELQRQLAAAQEEERLRIARDLHDQLGQQITGLQLGLKQLEEPAQGTPLAAMLPPLQALALDLAKEAHRLAVNLRPTVLEDVGLVPALEQLVASWGAQTGIAAAFHSHAMAHRRLPRQVEVALYRVAQEALTNVLKHAETTSVSVIVERRDSDVVVIVEDNGRGYDADEPPPEGDRPRLGILGMRERVAQIGGVLEVESSPGSGTTVLVRVPAEA